MRVNDETVARPSQLPGWPETALMSRRRLLTILTVAASGSWTGLPAFASGADSQLLLDVSQFLHAVQAGDRLVVEDLLDQNANLARARDQQGRSAFILAHLYGHPAIAVLLQSRGLELDIVEAVLAADWDRVEALAKANPELMNAAHPIGGNPLYASALLGRDEQYRLRTLGSDPDGRPEGGSGLSPARAAMNCRDPIGAWLAATDILSNGADPNAAQTGGDSIVHGAVRARDVRLLRLAIRKGGAVDRRDSAGQSPLDLAHQLHWQEGIQLLSHPEQIALDYRGSRFAYNASRERYVRDPLLGVPIATQNEVTGLSHFNPARVKELLAGNPQLIHAISTDAELAIEACGHTGQREVIAIHLDHGAALSLPTAISLGNLQHARWLLEKDPRLVNERGPHDFPLMWYPAIGKGSVEAAALLLAQGADIEQESGGETALHAAAARGQLDLIRFLVEKGANTQAIGYRQGRKGLTPLQLATAKEQAEAVALLTELA